MKQADIDEAIGAALNHYASNSWQSVIEYFGEELADEFDFTDEFSYEEIYQKGDLKECVIYSEIATIQRCIVSYLFDLAEDGDALLTWITLQYVGQKLFDRGTGVNIHKWLH